MVERLFCVCSQVCNCGAACSNPRSEFREASKSSSMFRAYVHRPCGKTVFSDLRCRDGPNASENVHMYKRQCCRFQLYSTSASLKAAAALKSVRSDSDASPQWAEKLRKANEALKSQCAAIAFTPSELENCADCPKCGMDACFPRCPIEWDKNKPASYKTYKPRLSPDGKSYQNELQVSRMSSCVQHTHVYYCS